MKSLPLIFDIRGFSLDDGPGIRTTVFFKGCPLSCVWCHNPESWNAAREVAFYPGLCIGCGDCSAVCPENAVTMARPGRIVRDRCTACGKCTKACPSTALKMIGSEHAPEALADLLLADDIFFKTSGGGVTFSGGEPLLHMDYLMQVMPILKGRGVHIALQTAGMFSMAEFREKVLPFIDLIFYDIKFIDSGKHRKFTGAGNQPILENFRSLLKENVQVIARTPLVPCMTAEEENIRAISRFVSEAGCRRYEVLPYNPGGIAKRRALGKNQDLILPETMMKIDEENGWKAIAKKSIEMRAIKF